VRPTIGLRRRVVRLAEVAVQPGAGGGVDDAAADVGFTRLGAFASVLRSVRHVSQVPQTWTFMTRSKSSADMFQTARSRTMPALLTTMSILPYVSIACCTMALAWASSPTSP
jgi:hypothetical protein